MNKHIEGLKHAALEKQKETMDKAKTALHKMIALGCPINFEQVAKRAGISKNWLYLQPELKERIKSLRNKQRGTQIDSSELAEKHKKTILELEEKIQSLKEQLLLRDKQIEVAYGKWFEDEN